jgi:hypothetical protein
MPSKPGFSFTAGFTAAAALLIGALTACSSAPKPLYQQEQFATGSSPFAHDFKSTPTRTCEAARRALLSQGYITSATRTDAIDGSKNFQQGDDSHVVIEFHVVCAQGDAGERSSTVYVNALQDRYALKKSNTNATVGLSLFGTLSLPIGSSDDAMVKVASETIPPGLFYERFFGLLTYYLENLSDDLNPAAVAVKPPVPPLPPVKAPTPTRVVAPAVQVEPAAVPQALSLPAVAAPLTGSSATGTATGAALTPADHAPAATAAAAAAAAAEHGATPAAAASGASASDAAVTAPAASSPSSSAPPAAALPSAASTPASSHAAVAPAAIASGASAANAPVGASTPTQAVPAHPAAAPPAAGASAPLGASAASSAAASASDAAPDAAQGAAPSTPASAAAP